MKMVDATWSKIEMYKTMFPTVGSSKLFGEVALFRHLETEEFEWEDPENVVCYEFWFDEKNLLTGKEIIRNILGPDISTGRNKKNGWTPAFLTSS